MNGDKSARVSAMTDYEVKVLSDEVERLLKKGNGWLKRSDFIATTLAAAAQAIEDRLEFEGVTLLSTPLGVTWRRKNDATTTEAAAAHA